MGCRCCRWSTWCFCSLSHEHLVVFLRAWVCALRRTILRTSNSWPLRLGKSLGCVGLVLQANMHQNHAVKVAKKIQLSDFFGQVVNVTKSVESLGFPESWIPFMAFANEDFPELWGSNTAKSVRRFPGAQSNIGSCCELLSVWILNSIDACIGKSQPLVWSKWTILETSEFYSLQAQDGILTNGIFQLEHACFL